MKISKTKSIIMFLPFLLFFLVFWAFPLLRGLFMSLHNWTVSGGNNGFVGLENYQTILTPGNIFSNFFIDGLKNTFIFVGVSVIPLVLIALLLALLLDSIPGKWKVFFRTVFFISYAVSVTTVSAIFKWLFTGNGGYINSAFASIGLDPIQWLNQQPYAWLVILITTVWWTIGYNMILFINALDEVDYSLYEAASLDGANAWERFRYITLPSIKYVTYFIIFNTVIASFNLYGQTLLITEGGPAQSTRSLIMNIQTTIFERNNLGIGTTMAITMGLIMSIVSAIQFLVISKENTD